MKKKNKKIENNKQSNDKPIISGNLFSVSHTDNLARCHVQHICKNVEPNKKPPLCIMNTNYTFSAATVDGHFSRFTNNIGAYFIHERATSKYIQELKNTWLLIISLLLLVVGM